MTEKITSWSISRAQVFEQCKYRAKLQWIDKIPDTQPKAAADRGTAIHQEAEDYVTGKSSILSKNLRHFHDDLISLRAHHDVGHVTCEEEWAFDKEWNPTQWKSGWLRLKLDACCHLTDNHTAVIDYKTGKRFGNEVKHAEQLQIYGLCTMLRYPDVEEVTAELWYIDQNELTSFKMKRKQLNRYLAIFDKKGRSITDCTEFPPNPNIFTCKYCPYHQSKQGDCKYGAPL